MTARFADVLEISLTMAVVLAVLLGLRPLLKEKLRAKAFYWVWLLAALRLCIPFNVSLPQAPVTVAAAPRQALVRVDTHRTNPGGTEYRVMTPLEAEQAQSAAYSARCPVRRRPVHHRPHGRAAAGPVLANRGGGVPGLASGSVCPLPPAGAPLGCSGGGRRPAGAV